MIANMGKMTGGIEIMSDAHPQSGTLKIGVIKTHRWSDWISLLFNALRGKIDESPHYILMQGRDIEIQCLKKATPYECDGNDFPPTKTLSITIYPAAVKVLVP